MKLVRKMIALQLKIPNLKKTFQQQTHYLSHQFMIVIDHILKKMETYEQDGDTFTT